jgi:hypothetical protein
MAKQHVTLARAARKRILGPFMSLPPGAFSLLSRRRWRLLYLPPDEDEQDEDHGAVENRDKQSLPKT